MSKIITHLT